MPMTLTEFDKIRKYLPDETQIEIVGEPPKTEPDDDEVWAVELCSWGNHDGRFNVMCKHCGDIFGQDIPRRQWNAMTVTYEHKACPKCGRVFIKKGDIKR